MISDNLNELFAGTPTTEKTTRLLNDPSGQKVGWCDKDFGHYTLGQVLFAYCVIGGND